jgi:poly-beta-1,6-N-acetyl-D-glucosamine synthase
VIVSDGSTDRTDEIAQRAAREHTWIEVVRMPERKERHFGGKAHCFNAGYERLRGQTFDLIGNLDADISFGPDYYEFLIARFVELPELGVAGTPFVEDPKHPERHSYAHRSANLEHVSGACQMFRRICFDTVGGYVPIKGGGVDWTAVTTARMKGWSTRTFIERVCFHHRPMGTAGRSAASARYRHGVEDYYVGGHPVWQLLRGLFQMKERPYVIGGFSLILGYYWSWLTRLKSPVPSELRAYHRQEQLKRLRGMWRRACGRKESSAAPPAKNQQPKPALGG